MKRLTSFHSQEDLNRFFKQDTIDIRVYRYLDWERGYGDGGTKEYLRVPIELIHYKAQEDINGDTFWRIDLDVSRIPGYEWGFLGIELEEGKREEELLRFRRKLEVASRIKTIKI